MKLQSALAEAINLMAEKITVTFDGDTPVFDGLEDFVDTFVALSQLVHEYTHVESILDHLAAFSPEAAESIRSFIAAKQDDPVVQKMLQAAELTLASTQAFSPENYDTYNHVRNVTVLTVAMAHLYDEPYDAEALFELLIAGACHDFGKIITPKEILHTSVKLTDEDWKIIPLHAVHSYEMLHRLEGVGERFPDLALTAAAHHESPNGSGYPYGLTEENTPLGAKLMKVADHFEAAAGERPYSPARSGAETVVLLLAGAERYFDGVLEHFVKSSLAFRFDEVREWQESAEILDALLVPPHEPKEQSMRGVAVTQTRDSFVPAAA